MMTAGSSAEVSAGAKASEARSASDGRSSAPSPGPSTANTARRSGRPARMPESLARPVASVMSAAAPQSRRRNSSACSPKSWNSGTETAPSLNAARCATAVSGTCGSSTATRSPRPIPCARSVFASRLVRAFSASKVIRSVPPSSRRCRRARRPLPSAHLSQQSTPML